MTDLRMNPDPGATRGRALWPQLAVLLLLPLGIGARDCERAADGDCDGGDCEEETVCRYGGKRFEAGDSFPSRDGCNQCQCQDDGSVACTERACAPNGCDYEGKHYDAGEGFKTSDGCNDCSCGPDGQVACTLRLCAEERATCGGLAGAQCPKGQFCSFLPEAHCGAADQSGLCLDVPDVCTREYKPVCGCDDKTYSNGCEAEAAGVSVAREGKCDEKPSAKVCGGLAGLQCDDGQYCNFAPDAQCGAADQTGTCADVPDLCTKEYKPVCGCDDKSYGNACEAAAAGVSVVRSGKCDDAASGKACGGLRGLRCDAGQYCNFAPDALCGAADATGICTEIRGACTREYRPVCGCDGMTYGNACTAGAAGVSVAHEGECEVSSGKACGGLAGLQCDAGQYCNYAPDALCGAADATGICTPIPEACTLEYLPVCGCDDKTYSNACAAASAGISIAQTSACK